MIHIGYHSSELPKSNLKIQFPLWYYILAKDTLAMDANMLIALSKYIHLPWLQWTTSSCLRNPPQYWPFLDDISSENHSQLRILSTSSIEGLGLSGNAGRSMIYGLYRPQTVPHKDNDAMLSRREPISFKSWVAQFFSWGRSGMEV